MKKIDVPYIVSWWVILGPILTLCCHWKRKWVKKETALAEGWKVKLYFRARAFQLTMRTDFLLSVCHLYNLVSWVAITVQRKWHFPERIRIWAMFQPGILTFTSCLWAQVGRKLPDAYQGPLFVTSCKSVWANSQCEMLLEAFNLWNIKWLVTMHISVLVIRSNQMWDARFSFHVS